MSILYKILGDPNEREIKKLQEIVGQINALEAEFERFSDGELRQKTAELESKIKASGSGPDGLDEVLPDAFALVRESAKRTLGQRHFDVQLMGGVVLHQGKIAEMRTGEGKTLAATAPVYLNALTGRGVHVVTVNDYLSKRDAVWMGQIYHLLGLTVGCISHETAYVYDPTHKVQDSQTNSNDQEAKRDETRDELGGFKVEDSYLRPCTRKEAYGADVTYGTNNEFGFDYLRDNMVYDLESAVQRGFSFAVVDEVDSILIDEARTPLIISAPDEESTSLYKTFSRIVPQLKENEDYNVDEKMKTVSITEEGVAKLEKILNIENIYDDQKGGGIRYVHQVEQALRANVLYQKDRDYVVRESEVVIVDEFTGRLMPGRRYSEGLHQAIEAKEGVEVQKESRTLASITFQNYFRMYEKLSGMTGTAMTSAEEFDRVYKLQIVAVPTNKPMVRRDHPDIVLRTSRGKMQAIVEEVKKRNAAGQPMLIGTTSIQNNELVSLFLQKAGVKHEVLNAKNHEKEGSIIAQAGKFGAVTVATNMAGRGVDIILGGNPPDEAKAKKVRDAGGLFVLGTERHEARRIDNQLRGRSGRQGDPGETQFFLSLDDDLMRVFGGDRIKGLMETLKIPEDQPIKSGLISNSIEGAQGKIEGYHFDARKHVLDYDEVLNKQRNIIYGKRRELPPIKELIEEELRKMVDFHMAASHPGDWNIEEIFENVKGVAAVSDDFHKELSAIRSKSADPDVLREEIAKAVLDVVGKAYKEKEERIGNERMRELEKFVMLRTLDTIWMEHLETMDSLRDSVKLRAYGQKDPLVEYKREGHEMFGRLLDTWRNQAVLTIFKVELKETPHTHQQEMMENRDTSDGIGTTNRQVKGDASRKIGRNDPCHCGSGKKFKKCHGK